jgi:hypothetical protein
VADPPVTVLVRPLPAGLDTVVTLPSSAFAIRSPAATGNAVEAEVKLSDFLPAASVTTAARMPAFRNDVAAAVGLSPAASIAALLFATRVSISVTPARLVVTRIWLRSPNPGPRK